MNPVKLLLIAASFVYMIGYHARDNADALIKIIAALAAYALAMWFWLGALA